MQPCSLASGGQISKSCVTWENAGAYQDLQQLKLYLSQLVKQEEVWYAWNKHRSHSMVCGFKMILQFLENLTWNTEMLKGFEVQGIEDLGT